MQDGEAPRRLWTEEETVLALFLYFQLPFGKLHSGNKEIQQLALSIGRSASSVAMKLTNFASLDPKIVASGRSGLKGASSLDRRTYQRFGEDWSGLASQAETLWHHRIAGAQDVSAARSVAEPALAFDYGDAPLDSTRQALISQRVGQGFFRRAVMANYEGVCCMSGIAEPQVLIASHIRPWSDDIENRHNPANGLLLAATLDRAFDQGLITVGPDRRVRVSRPLLESRSKPTRAYFERYQDAEIRPARRMDPDPAFLEWHSTVRFVDARA